MNKPNYSIEFAIAVCIFVFCLLCAIPKFTYAADTVLWDSLRSGESIALMRHTIAPGTGDPPEFMLGDCNTQRNLSSEGRDQAMRIGARLRENGIHTARVFSSQWCRCLDTARLLELDAVAELTIINSFFQQYENREPQTQALREWITAQNPDDPLILVTHQVNITALTGIYPSSGEMVIIRRAGGVELEVVGTIKTD